METAAEREMYSQLKSTF